MKRLLRLAARLYPAAWRSRYGVEFQALLEETRPGWRDIVDVLSGGLQMHLKRGHPALTVAAFSIVGAFGAGAIGFHTAARFASKGTMTLRPAVASTAPESAWLQDMMPRLAGDAFSRDFLAALIQKHRLYDSEFAQPTTDDLVNRMRGDIGIQLMSRSLVQVSFASREPHKAQQVAADLMSQLVQANFVAGRGSIVQLIDPPDEPRVSVSSRQVAVAGLGGLSGGALIGTLFGLVRRRPSRPAS
jgi:hypothetical protein